MEISKSKEHVISLKDVGVIKEIIRNRKDPRELLREMLSNSASKEVKASNIEIAVGEDVMEGSVIIISDDGCGMKYSGEENSPKRLDKFLNFGYSKVGGEETDEFGYKGLGTALMYDSSKVEVQTQAKNSSLYKVEIESSAELLEKDPPTLPYPRIAEHDVTDDQSKGTTIKIYGYAQGRLGKKWEEEKLINYLKNNTIVGCTQDRPLPNIFLKVGQNSKKKIETGYPWITTSENDKTGETVVFQPVESIETDKDEHGNDTEVKVILKGGMTHKTGKFGMSGHKNTGIRLSVNGIPYFRLQNSNYYIGHYLPETYWKFCNFVVECNDLLLNMNRNDYYAGNIEADLFHKGLRNCLKKLSKTEKYKRFVEYRRKKQTRELANSLEERKNQLSKSTQKYVVFDETPLHTVPRSEKDVLALLWKLEGKDALPFYYFCSLEHTSQVGMDLIVNFQEAENTERLKMIAVEVEYSLDGFDKHDHVPGQCSKIFCWKADIEKTYKGSLSPIGGLPYKYIYEREGFAIEVFELQNLPNISVFSKKEIEEEKLV